MEGNSITAQVADLEKRYADAVELLGMVLATLNLPSNRSKFGGLPCGDILNELSAKWWHQFETMRGNVVIPDDCGHQNGTGG